MIHQMNTQELFKEAASSTAVIDKPSVSIATLERIYANSPSTDSGGGGGFSGGNGGKKGFGGGGNGDDEFYDRPDYDPCQNTLSMDEK